MKSALESAVSFGLLESNVSEIRYSRRFGGEIQTAIGRKYIVTNLGESVFRSVSEGADFITICYGEYRIDEIQSFSEPSDMMGYRVTNVNYVYTIVNIEKWARERNVLEWVKDSWSMGPFEANIASKQLTDDLLDEPQNESITLHLTNQGWSAEQPSFR
ncbi:MAG: hypothetical protein OXG25_10665 [Gammaproteobacteria bacterium]|nr:hypothetical protein [Gammaproteobacteria bacterium]